MLRSAVKSSFSAFAHYKNKEGVSRSFDVCLLERIGDK